MKKDNFWLISVLKNNHDNDYHQSCLAFVYLCVSLRNFV
jgi:hypothetical protein